MPTNLSLYPLDFNINSEEDMSLAAAINRLKIVNRDTALRTVYTLRMAGQKEASSGNNIFTNLDFNGKKLTSPAEGAEKDWWHNPIFTGIPKAPTPVIIADTSQVATVGCVSQFAMPIGSVVSYTFTTDPDSNWMVANGRALSRTTYLALFTKIQSEGLLGTVYGVGDGTTTFTLPNMATRVPVGAGGGYTLGATGGAATHTLTNNEMPWHNHIADHSHSITEGGHSHKLYVWTTGSPNNDPNVDSFLRPGEDTAVAGEVSNNKGYLLKNSDNSQLIENSTTGITINSTYVNDTNRLWTYPSGEGQPHNNMQPYIVLNYIIKVR